MEDNAVIAHHLFNFYTILFEDDDEDEEELGNTLSKIYNFAEEVVPNYRDHQFQFHFRLNPELFESLFQNIGPIYYEKNYVHPLEVYFEKQLMIFLWYMANTETYRQVADRFGISKSTALSIVVRVGKLFLKFNERNKIISWPSQERCVAIANHFEQKNGFSGAIGAIDGCHIRILKPKGPEGNAYINRKSFPSLILQGICDNNKLFTDVYIGECGSNHDEYVFQKSDIHERIASTQIQIHENHHILGDLAYKLRPYLIVGFKRFANRTARQLEFNRKLSEIRVVIENAFGLLKGRWRRLKYFENIKHEGIVVLVMAACILHNICILNGDYLFDADVNEELNNPDNVEMIPINDGEMNRRAREKRDLLMEAMIPNE